MFIKFALFKYYEKYSTGEDWGILSYKRTSYKQEFWMRAVEDNFNSVAK